MIRINKDYGLVDDNGHRLIFFYTGHGECLARFMSDCVSAQYNVLEDKVLELRWGGVKWDYAQVALLNFDNQIAGLRMVVQSLYLTPYYQIKNLLDNKDSLRRCLYWSGWDILSDFEFSVKYETNSIRTYKIIFEIREKCFKRIEEVNGKLYLR